MTGAGGVLVAGATGFIGRAVVREFARQGSPVSCVVRRSGAGRRAVDAPPGVTVVEVTAFERLALRAVLASLAVEVVVNLAAYGVDPEDRQPDAMLEGNLGVVVELLQALAGRPVARFIHAGSCSEYAPPADRELLTEDSAIGPVSLYGAAKAASVTYGAALARHLGIPFVTLRLFGVFGAGEGPRRLVPYVIDHLVRGTPVDLTPGEQVRDVLHVEDVAAAFAAVAASEVAPSAVYNVCSGRPVSVREIAETVADTLGKPRALLRFGARAYRADEPMWLVGSNRRFVQASGWRPTIALRDGIARTLEAAETRDARV